MVARWPTLKRKPVESHCLFSPPFSHYARPMHYDARLENRTLYENRVCIDEIYKRTLYEKWVCIDEWQSRLSYRLGEYII